MEKTLKTPRGAEIVVHYEGNEAEEKWCRVPLDEQTMIIREGLSVQKNDTGKKTTMHLLVNNEFCVQLLTADEYVDWQNTEPDWFHYRESIRGLVKEILPVIMMAKMLSSGLGIRRSPFGSMFMDDPFGYPGDFFDSMMNHFDGPSDEFLDKIDKDKEMYAEAIAVHESNEHNCSLCFISCCPIRHASFNEAAYNAALAEIKKAPADDNSDKTEAGVSEATEPAVSPESANTTEGAPTEKQG